MAYRAAQVSARRRALGGLPIFGLTLVSLIGGAGIASSALAGPALPTGGSVQAGSASISGSASGLTINQTSSRAIINWSSFSIGQGGAVQFNNGDGATLNRVTGATASQIDGLLSGTGSVYLVNSNGVVIGKSGVVKVGGTFAASTLDVANGQFMGGGDLTFTGDSNAAVINYGKIGALGGDVAMIAAKVVNSGEIDAANGDVGLIAGYQVTLRDASLDDGKFAVVLGGAGTSVTNGGLVQAADAELRANGGSVYALAGNTSSVIKATGVAQGGGKVFLVSDGGGSLAIGGTIQARAADGAGGAIETSGSYVTIGSGAIDAGKGGEWLIDPYDLTIDSTAAGTIMFALASSSVTLQTTATSAPETGVTGAGIVNANGQGDIDIISDITWGTGSTLTLDAYHSVAIDALLHPTGAGGIVIKTNDGGSGGGLSFGASGRVQNGGAGSVHINNVNYTLETSVANLILAMNSNANGVYALVGNSTAMSGVGTNTNPVSSFAGTVEGLGNTFTATNVNWTAGGGNIGIIGYLTGTIADVHVTGANTTVSGGASNAVGGLVGQSFGTIRNVTVSGTVNAAGGGAVGGVVGSTAGGSPYGVFNSSFSGTVTGNVNVGGLAGYSASTLSGDFSSGSVNGAGNSIGGLVGDTEYQVIASYSSSSVTGSVGEANLGGLAGLNNTGGSITTSYSTGAVTAGGNTTTGSSNVGGFIGQNLGSITNAYTTSSVSTNGNATNVGGFVGYNGGGATIQDAYASTGGFTTTGDTSVGGFAGNVASSNAIHSAVWNSQLVGGQGVGAGQGQGGVVGETTAMMQDASAYATNFSGFDFTNVWAPPVSGSHMPELYGVSGVVKITVNNGSIIYGNVPPGSFPIQAYGLQGNDVAGVLTGLTFNDGGASSTADVGTYVVSQTATSLSASAGSGLTYRVVTNTPGNLTITPRPLTISLCTFAVGTCEVEKTYDGGNLAFLTSSDFNIATIVNGDDVTVAAYSAVYKNVNVVSNTTTTPGEVDISGLLLGGAKAADYTIANSGVLKGNIGVIDPRTVTAVLNGTFEKTYDDNANVTITLTTANYSLANVITADASNLNINAGTGTYNNKNAGSGKQVTYVGLGLGGSAAPNYVLQSTTATSFGGKIDPLAITVSLTGTATKVYDGTTAAALPNGYTFATVFSDDAANVALAAGSGDYNSKDVSATSVTFGNLSLTGSAATNYNLTTTSLSGAGSITPKELTLNLVGTIEKIYDGNANATIATTNYQVTGVVPGDSVTLSDPTHGTYDTPNAGSGKLVTVAGSGLSLSGPQATDYTVSAYTGPGLSANIGIITAQSLSVALIGSVSKTYDGTTTATLTSANYQLTGAPGGVTLVEPLTGTYDNPNAGTGKNVTVTGLALTGTGSSNFSVPSMLSGAIGTILAKQITATLTGTITKVYDGTTNATLGSNYTFAVGDIIGGDVVTLSASAGHYDTKDVTGSPTKLVTFTDFLSGAQASDYKLATNTISGNVGAITPKAISAIILTGTIEKTYDGGNVAVLGNHYSLAGLVTADQSGVTLIAGAGVYDTKDVGTGKTVTFTGLTLTGAASMDYTIPLTASGAVGKIDPKAITAAISGTITKVYDGSTTAALGGNYTFGGGVYGGDTVTLTGVGTYDTKNVGTGKMVRFNSLVLGGAQAFDYTLSTTSMTGATVGVITPASVSITINSVVKTYDATRTATLTAGEYTVTGMVAGDGVTATATSGQFDTKDVGTGKSVTFTGLKLTGGNAANYTLTSTTSTNTVGVINAKAVTVTLIGSVIKTFDGTTVATLTTANYLATGFIVGDTVALNNPTTGAYATSAVGTGILVTASNVQLTGASAGDYVLSTHTPSASIGQIKASIIPVPPVVVTKPPITVTTPVVTTPITPVTPTTPKPTPTPVRTTTTTVVTTPPPVVVVRTIVLR
jgi:filamentous hemagglutinin family protein